MEENKKKAYSEIVEILKLIEDEEKLSKIPFEVIEMFKNNSDPEYKPTISMEIPLEEQNLMNETYSILGFIATKYWQDTLEEEVSVNNEVQEEKIEEVEEVTEELAETNTESLMKTCSMYILNQFFIKPYSDDADFYTQFNCRLLEAKVWKETIGWIII